MTTDFPLPKGYNRAGLQSFIFIHALDVLTMPPLMDLHIPSFVEILPDKTWLKGYSTPFTLNFKEETQENPNGKLFMQTLSGFLPGDSPETANIMDKMENNYYVLVFKDTQNRSRLAGGYGYPMLFSATFDSGSARVDSRGYAFKFIAYSPFRAPFYM